MSLIICCLLIAGTQDASIRLTDGSVLNSSVLKIEQGEISLANGQKLLVKEIRRIIFKPTADSRTKLGIHVHCHNGTSVGAKRMLFDGKWLQLLGQNDAVIATLPRTMIKRLQLNADVTKEQWAGLDTNAIKADGLVVLRGGKLDVVEGVVLSLDKDGVKFKNSDRIVSIQYSKIVGITFFQLQPHKLQHRVVVQDVFGNTFRCQSIDSDQESMLLTIDKTNSFKIPTTNIAEIDFSQGQFVYLDALKPQTVNWRPFFQAKFRDAEIAALFKDAQSKKIVWTKNESFGDVLRVDAGNLRSDENPVGRVTFDRGVSIKGGTKLVFTIPDQAVGFQATAGIQTSKSRLGSVILRLACDGKELQTFKLSAQDRDLAKINIPLKGSRLFIEVDYGDQQDFGDILTMGNARFLRQ